MTARNPNSSRIRRVEAQGIGLNNIPLSGGVEVKNAQAVQATVSEETETNLQGFLADYLLSSIEPFRYSMLFRFMTQRAIELNDIDAGCQMVSRLGELIVERRNGAGGIVLALIKQSHARIRVKNLSLHQENALAKDVHSAVDEGDVVAKLD